MQIALESRQNGVAVVRPSGRLDFATAAAAREFLAAALAEGHRRLVVDLGAVESVDSAGLGAMIYGVRKARQAGGDLSIVDPHDRVRLLMSLTALDQIIDRHATLDEALAVVSSGAGQPILSLRLPATAAGMDILHQSLAACWTTLAVSRTLDPSWREAFTLAVAEVAANIIQFAHSPEEIDPQFELSLTSSADRLTARFVDWGSVVLSAAQLATLPTVTLTGDPLNDRGRGLAIIRMATDHFAYQRTADGENHWLIEKTFQASPARQDPPQSPDVAR
jgi:anti-sigma B factor antagonist